MNHVLATHDTVALSGARELLDFLPVLYPNGDIWLARRIEEVNAGTAIAHTVYDGEKLVGLALGVSKPAGRFKISTLFVHPSFRSRGIGQNLLTNMLASAQSAGSSEVYITGAHTVRSELLRLLGRTGFELIATELDRYGCGRHEDVYRKR